MQQFATLGKSPIGNLHQKGNRTTSLSMSGDAPYVAIGERLTRVRLAFSDLNQKEWAEKHGFQRVQYHAWEKGKRRIPVEHAEKLADLYGLDLDFIYRGRRSGLAETVSNKV